MHYDLSSYGIFTVLLAFCLACMFASYSGMPRMKLPEEPELTMAKVITNKIPRRKSR